MPRDQHVDDPRDGHFPARGDARRVARHSRHAWRRWSLVNRTAASDTPAPAPGDAATSDFMRLLGLRYPIAQAPTSGRPDPNWLSRCPMPAPSARWP